MEKEAFALNAHITDNNDSTFHLYEGHIDDNGDFYYARKVTQCKDRNVEFHTNADEIYTTKKMRTRLAEIENDNEKEICANCVKTLYKNG